MTMIEKMARALCKARGDDPDRLEPGDCPCGDDDSFAMTTPDGRNRQGEFCHFAWREHTNAARAALTAIEQAGYKVVPVEPTEAMMRAGNASGFRASVRTVTLDVYRAMLAAAPEVK